MINNKIGWLKAAKFWFNKAESMDDVAAKLAEEAMWRCLFRWVVGKDLDFEI